MTWVVMDQLHRYGRAGVLIGQERFREGIQHGQNAGRGTFLEDILEEMQVMGWFVEHIEEPISRHLWITCHVQGQHGVAKERTLEINIRGAIQVGQALTPPFHRSQKINLGFSHTHIGLSSLL